MTNKTENGIYYSHGSFLTDGWSNEGLWQLDFDIKATSWVYVGPMPVCSAEVNPYTDAKRANYAIMTCWEGLHYFYAIEYTIVSETSLSKIRDSNWHHVTIEKLTDTQFRIIIDEVNISIRDFPAIATLTYLHIGSRDNPSSRNYGGIIQYKNIKVKKL